MADLEKHELTDAERIDRLENIVIAILDNSLYERGGESRREMFSEFIIELSKDDGEPSTL